ncbi:MAG: S26 family signal peptidase [Planctomycetaceae bacterium]|nr:MAG: S26 family signal peptidase [Planctomycetaceae bacterium]
MIAGCLLGGLSGLVAWTAARRRGRIGDETGSGESAASDHLIGGASMAPTLWGAHAELACDGCGIAWPIHWQPNFRPRGPVTCWNCGADVSTATADIRSGTRVRLHPIDRDRFLPTAGQLVAIKVSEQPDGLADQSSDRPAVDRRASDHSQLTVKRIAALPGQLLSHRDGLLCVDDRPIDEWFDDLAHTDNPPTAWPVTFPVHEDAYRPSGGVSRWAARATVGPTDISPSSPAATSASLDTSADPDRIETPTPDSIRGIPGGFQLAAEERPSAWLTYHHRAAYDRLRPDVIRDDVPGNATEVRTLRPVDRLQFSLTAVSTGRFEIEVEFRLAGHRLVARRVAEGGPIRLEFDSATASLQEALTASSQPQREPPISLRLTFGTAEIRDLAIHRRLRYRIEPAEAVKLPWPLRLGPEEIFVLGDNVPLSIDSRHFGPISIGQLVGRIELAC